MKIPLTVQEKADLFDVLHEKHLELSEFAANFERFADNLFADNCYKTDGKCDICGKDNH